MESEKPIHTLVLDTGPIIRNHPTVSSLIAQSEELITVPAIISEIRDAVTRTRVETTLVPFLKLRSPTEASIKFVTDFARKTGDAAVLSRVDLQIAALAYELECELNGGDWRLRNAPGQKRVNGAPPKKDDASGAESAAQPDAGSTGVDTGITEQTAAQTTEQITEQTADQAVGPVAESVPEDKPQNGEAESTRATAHADEASSAESAQIAEALSETTLEKDALATAETTEEDSSQISAEEAPETESEPESDGGEWITPTNLKRKQARDAGSSGAAATTTTPKMQVATITTDNALQNLLLQINLNLVSGSLARISQIRTTLLRCHACFLVHKKPDLQFCQRCGKPTLTRVTCTTDASGGFKVHLKKNIQWSHRGDRYSIPKPVHGSTNGRIHGGGKGGWGNDLVLAEDQKEYARSEERRKREEKKGRSMLDEDYLPGLLTGKREGRPGGRMKVGAGKDVNSRKR
ncbi:hypothetical protein K461DRAFT_139644 [Myriangium duriaei CBS 260.36]|uniref:20S-pre-rRNA D-site endonuclease NOB1 n=1 Tax=Myriangium duriaei CBS 260.36 TaxID=1168546 RepID=A0A9P4J3F2_9PEZI|nr:hypothetical protein K461DRAFT_139644 [Myriangium duriaei CBS 260.36]